MAAETWPCSECGERGVKNLLTRGYCADHLSALLATFGSGVGHPGPSIGVCWGLPQPAHGAGYWELRCLACGATWTGRPGEPCDWCERADENLRRWQAELLLRPELPDTADKRRADSLEAWCDRLRRGIDAGLISDYQAESALRRELER